MRESNFSNPYANKACVCISAAVYDRRAIDCTATLPLINSLNHLAYLTSTSPRIREMVCLDGGLERLIRILRQVPRSPSQPALRGVITKEMQSIWKWSLAFQCVVNIGVRGSEIIRTRVVEAGMIPVAVRVLESYLKIADAIRDEKKREARKEEARLRLKTLTEATLEDLTDANAAAPLARRGAISSNDLRGQTQQLIEAGQGVSRSGPRQITQGEATSPSNTVVGTHTSEGENRASASAAMDSISPSTSSPSVNGSAADGQASSSMQGQSGSQRPLVAAYPSGILTNVSSVEDFTASASGSDGAEDAEMEGEESEMDSITPHGEPVPERSRESSNGVMADSEDAFEGEDRATPRPPRRVLAPMGGTEARNGIPAAWQVASDAAAAAAAASVTPMREATVTSTPRREPNAAADDRARVPSFAPEQVAFRQAHPAAAATAVAERSQAAAAAAARQPAHHQHHHSHHHHHQHHHHGHRERQNQSENVLHPSDMIYRDEEVLLSLQLLAYISKYAHVRALFHCDLSLLSSLETLSGNVSEEARDSTQSWNPSLPSKKNVFCIAERYTLRSSRTGLSHFAANGESRIAPEIQYWAGVIMRNACRKDENQGGIRQCANMLCGKWEKTAREFAKCRKCRKAKYCSKMCQSKGWQMGHRFWCSSRSDDDHPDAKAREKMAAGPDAPGPAAAAAAAGGGLADEAMRLEGPPRPLAPPGAGAGAAAPTPERRHVAVGTDEPLPGSVVNRPRQPSAQDLPQQQQQAQGPQQPAIPTVTHPSPGHTHVSPSPLFTSRIQQRVYPAEMWRRSGSSSSAAGPHGGQGEGRRVPSAIPTHLQAPSSDDNYAGGSRSRTVSAASSGGEQSDMSDDEMERASRRVLASTVSPVQRSPGMNLTPLAAMTTADEVLMSLTSVGTEDVGAINATAAGMVPTRTDLAGRPLPPPVIAQHDAGMGNELDMRLPPGEDMIGGRLTPGVHEENENAGFGRGDFDQMIWRGRTPAAEDEEESRDGRRRGSTVTGRSMMQQQQTGETEDEEDEEEDEEQANQRRQRRVSNGHIAQQQASASPSLLNSALLLAGGSSSSSSASRTMAASPRYPSTHGLHAPVARQPHRFASVAASSSPISSSSSLNVASNHSFVRGSLAGTFGDWRQEDGHSHRHHQHPHDHATGLGLDGHPSTRLHSSSSTGRLTSAPAYASTFGQDVSSAGERNPQDDFVVPAELQDLLNTVDNGDEMQLDS